MEMSEFKVLHEYGKELENRIRLQSYPLAVKLLTSEDEIPPGAERPLNDWGYHVPLCQGYAQSRKEGATVAMFKEDMWCFEPVVGYGWAEPPQYFLDGHNRFPEDVKDLEAGKNYAHDFPRLEVGTYIGVVSAPLTTLNFRPDLVMLYCNSEQLSLLLLGREYMDGHDLPCHLSSHAACVYSVVPAIRDSQCQVAIPCRGDRYYALAGGDEIIFTVPTEKIEDLLEGLRHLETTDSKLPKSANMQRQPWFPDSYMKILRMVVPE
jgi:uncharacterized protein (DUF169 family)